MTDAALKQPSLSKILGVVENLHQRVHVLERVAVGLISFGSEGQRAAALLLLNQAVHSYKPAITEWPEMADSSQADIAEVVAAYRALFTGL